MEANDKFFDDIMNGDITHDCHVTDNAAGNSDRECDANEPHAGVTLMDDTVLRAFLAAGGTDAVADDGFTARVARAVAAREREMRAEAERRRAMSRVWYALCVCGAVVAFVLRDGMGRLEAVIHMFGDRLSALFSYETLYHIAAWIACVTLPDFLRMAVMMTCLLMLASYMCYEMLESDRVR